MVRDIAGFCICIFVAMGADSLIETPAGIFTMFYLLVVAIILQVTKTEEERNGEVR